MFRRVFGRSLPIVLLVFCAAACVPGGRNETEESSSASPYNAAPFGWTLVKIDDPNVSILTTRALDTLLPQNAALVQFPVQVPVFPTQGVVVRNLIPVWIDVQQTALVTRLAKNERVSILRKEGYRSGLSGFSRSYYIEDRFGNRGYIDSGGIAIPILSVADSQLGVYEAVVQWQEFELPYARSEVFGQPIELPVILHATGAFALFPDIFWDTEPVRANPARMAIGVKHAGGRPSSELYVTYVQADADQTVTSCTIVALESDPIEIRGQYAFRIEGAVHAITAGRFYSNLPSTGDTTAPQNEAGTVFELSGYTDGTLFARRIEFVWRNGAYLQPQIHDWELPLDTTVENSVHNAAIRRGPSQNSELITRIAAGISLEPLAISVPADIVLRTPGYWVQIRFPGGDGDSVPIGWIWGDFLRVASRP